MPKEEIIAGLKQAIERGYSLEQAKQSFVNAGYNSADVENAAASLSATNYPEMQPQQTFQPQPRQTPPSQQITPTTQQFQIPRKQKSVSKTLIILLLIILLLLLMGLSATIFFKEEMTEFINNLSF